MTFCLGSGIGLAMRCGDLTTISRKRGSPRNTRMQSVYTEAATIGYSWTALEVAAQDREK